MTIVELKEKLGMNSRVGKVKCCRCGKELQIPNMYSDKERREYLKPYCPTAVILVCQWLIHHGWHISSLEAKPPHMYYCPDCFPKGTSEYHKSKECDAWCEQAEKWMKENNEKR